jgi:branched-chain amino acid transport system substrate-binding protein
MVRHFVAAAVVAVVAGASFAAAAADPVKIGFSLPRSGMFSSSVAPQENGYALWREQVNARGGLDVAGTKRPVEFVIYDDQSEPSKAVQIYEKLITDDKVDLIFAPWGTAHHFAVVGIADRYKYPLIGNTASSVKLQEIKSNYFWMVAGQPDDLAVRMVEMMKAQNVKSVAILALQLPFSLELREQLEPLLKKESIQVAVAKDYPPTVKDMTALLAAVQQAKPDAVLSLSYPSDSVLYMNQSRELGITAPFQFVLIGPSIPFFRKMFGANADGITTLGYWTPHQKKWERAAPFYEAYKKKYNDEPDYTITTTVYSSCEVMEQAIAKVGLNREALREAIATGKFSTITGEVTFKGKRSSLPSSVSQIQNGEIHIIWPPELATSSFKPKVAAAKN